MTEHGEGTGPCSSLTRPAGALGSAPSPAPPPAGLKRCAGCDTPRPLRDFRHGNKPASELKTCAGCRARVAERRRERKEEERGELRARALDLAQALLFLADSHPEYRAELNALAQRIQRRGGGHHDRAAEAVTAAVTRHGCHSVSDIADQTGMTPSDVSRVLGAMRAAGLAETRPVRRGDGSTRELWFLVGGGRGGSDVLP